jgi:hypothetical protein
VLPGGNLGGKGVLLLILAGLLVWGVSGFYRVDTNEYGVVLRFGAFSHYADPGLDNPDRFLRVSSLEHAVALAALLVVLEKLEYRNKEERISIAEALRDTADRIEHRVLVQ